MGSTQVCCLPVATISITGGSIAITSTAANGAFATGKGSTVNLSLSPSRRRQTKTRRHDDAWRLDDSKRCRNGNLGRQSECCRHRSGRRRHPRDRSFRKSLRTELRRNLLHWLYQRDEQFLSDLIEQIKHATQTSNFPLVEDRKPCLYCLYRSFCDRGEQAGPVAALPEEPQETLDPLALDWDQIAEIQF